MSPSGENPRIRDGVNAPVTASSMRRSSRVDSSLNCSVKYSIHTGSSGNSLSLCMYVSFDPGSLCPLRSTSGSDSTPITALSSPFGVTCEFKLTRSLNSQSWD
eukprot:GHVN01054565.1.p1 GENE.GHVN01054565.1~~GHVN01054565.1.p1  ORF type:complete len:114 (-),score=6.18 GHVN01054565.1:190-498(-)